MKYVIPAPKKMKNEGKIKEGAIPAYVPSVYLPVSKEMISKLKTGTEIEVVVKAKIVGVESREHADGYKRNEICLEPQSIEIPSLGNKFSKLAEDD